MSLDKNSAEAQSAVNEAVLKALRQYRKTGKTDVKCPICGGDIFIIENAARISVTCDNNCFYITGRKSNASTGEHPKK